MLAELRDLMFARTSAFGLGPVVGLYGWIELAAWCAIAVGGARLARRAHAQGIERGAKDDAVLVVVAALLRLLVGPDNYNWYLAVGSAIDDPSVYTRATYLPLPSRVAGFWLEGGFTGIAISNLLLGTICVPLLRHALLALGVGARPALNAAWLAATLPVYVRLSASDTSQIVVLLLWCVSARAYAEVRAGRAGWEAHALLVAAPVAGMTIRIESAALFGGFVLLGPGALHDLGTMRSTPTRLVATVGGLGAGAALALLYHGTASHHVGAWEVIALGVLLLPLRMLGVMCPFPTQYVPALLAVPIGAYLIHGLRTRDRRALVATFLPLALLSAPFVATGTVLATDLSSSSYSVLYIPFLLVAAGEGLVLLRDRYEAMTSVGRRRAGVVAVLLGVAALLLAVDAYRWTYVFQEERRFLEAHLPDEDATILALFEPHGESGDFDCCLALPYPPWLASRPALRWRVLHDGDLDAVDLGALDFDYYYAGSLVALDIDRPTPWSLSELLARRDDPATEADRRMLRRLRRFDAAVRARVPLEPIAAARVPARWTPLLAQGTTGVNFGFSEDPGLVLYRRRDGAP